MIVKNRIKLKEITVKDLGKEITVCGWVRTARNQKNFTFLQINDGSMLSNLQVIIDENVENYAELIKGLTTGASLLVQGRLVESPGGGQQWELKAEKITLFGTCPTEEYPLQKKRHTFEFLRTIAHLRPRTNTQGAVARMRNAMSFATHQFFQERGFLYVHTPIIASADCEGAGKQFAVTTLDLKNVPKNPDQSVNYTKDFFGKPVFLTVSGQLDGEIYASALSDIYTFGPTFRAENSNTSRHLAEFWMIEPEMAFADLEADMENAESYLKYVVNYALQNCSEEMQFFDQHIDKGIIERLQSVSSSDFEHLTYTQAIDILAKANRTFEFPHTWGCDLQSEHERYLCEEYCKKPVILTDYPKQIKAFYMRDNDDGKTVAAMDILVPKIGEIVGGSQREERADILAKKISDFHLDLKDYWWYAELRKFGSVPHAGYGVGFERLLLFVTGMENIRDVIPFPRFPGHAEF
jgi:asparaginyl-tRNA synthetase